MWCDIMFSMKVRYKYRLRPGKQAERYLLAEWDACRYVWNRMVDESQARYERGETFGAAQAQKYLTFLRASKTDKDGGKWLAAHSCVPPTADSQGLQPIQRESRLRPQDILKETQGGNATA